MWYLPVDWYRQKSQLKIYNLLIHLHFMLYLTWVRIVVPLRAANNIINSLHSCLFPHSAASRLRTLLDNPFPLCKWICIVWKSQLIALIWSCVRRPAPKLIQMQSFDSAFHGKYNIFEVLNWAQEQKLHESMTYNYEKSAIAPVAIQTVNKPIFLLWLLFEPSNVIFNGAVTVICFGVNHRVQIT